jgi:cytochrome P450
MVAEFNPYSPEFAGDPFAQYRRLRAEDPVHRSPLGAWFISRYADAHALLRDRRLGRDFSVFLNAQMGDTPLRRMLGSTMLYNDPPHHTRLRTLVSKAFTPRAVEAMAPRISTMVDDLLDAVAAAGRMDVVADLAYPLPVQVICDMVGIPRADHAILRTWSRDFAATLEFVLPPDVLARGNAAAVGSTDYLRALIRERRQRPADDVLTRLIAAEEEGQTLSEEEIISTCMLLFSAGHETTTGLIGNAVLTLLRHPEQMQRLATEPGRIRDAVLEFLRYEPSIHMTSRMAVADVEAGGTTIAAGDVVVVLLAAANRDPDRFADPDTFDVGRVDNEPLTFGGGLHHCLGNALARLETEIAIATLLRRCPALRRADTDPPTWLDTVTIRGLKKLDVAFEPQASRRRSAEPPQGEASA